MYNYVNPIENIKPEEIIVYLRKSRADDPLLTVEEVLAKHESILDEWSERNLGGKVPECNKFREVVSGETIEDRPEVQRILRMIESPKYKAILTVEVQRLSRGDLEDAGRIIKLLRYTNTLVITTTKTYNITDEYDRDSFERELKRGNEFLEYQKKIMNRGRLLSVSQGNFIGSIPPYGYDKIFLTEGKRKIPTLKENKEKADVVRLIFDLYVNKDMGHINICHYLDSMGIPPANGVRWSPAALSDMLQNIHYIGKVKWNWRKNVKIVEDSEIVITRPKSKSGEYLVFEGRHEAIVSEDLFNAAKEKKGRNHRSKSTTKIRNPLAGLLYCQCGRAMTLRTHKKDGRDRCAPRLLCVDQVHCGTSSCLYDEMIDAVKSILSKSIMDFELRIEAESANPAQTHEKIIKSLEQKLEKLQAKEIAQWEAQTDPDSEKRMPPDVFKQLNAKLLKEKEEVQQALNKAYDEVPDPVDYAERVVTLREALALLRDPSADASLQNKMLKACIERIEYSRDRVERLKRKPGEAHGETLIRGANWSETPFHIDVKLRV